MKQVIKRANRDVTLSHSFTIAQKSTKLARELAKKYNLGAEDIETVLDALKEKFRDRP